MIRVPSGIKGTYGKLQDALKHGSEVPFLQVVSNCTCYGKCASSAPWDLAKISEELFEFSNSMAICQRRSGQHMYLPIPLARSK